MTSGSVFFAGAGGLLSQNNSNFFWDNTNTALDIGTSTTISGNILTVNGSGYFAGNLTVATTTGTTTIASNLQVNYGSLAYDVPSGVTNIDALQTGALNFDTDAGAVSWADLPLDSTPTQGTIESMSAQVGDTPILTVYGESNGSGGVQNTRIGIGTTSPIASLDVSGMGTDSPFIVASSSGTQYFNIGSTGNVGVGTSTPVSVFAVTGLSTFAGNVVPALDNTYSLGGSSTMRWSTIYTATTSVGDLLFGNNFRIVEATTTSGQASTSNSVINSVVWKNENSQQIFNLDENGNLSLTGDVCAFGADCLAETWNGLNTLTNQVSALSSTTATLNNSTSIADLTAQISGLTNQVSSLANFASSTTAWMSASSTITSLAAELAGSSFASSTFASSTFTSIIASSTATTLASSTSFIQTIANAVIGILQSSGQVIQSAGNWVVNQITATIGIFTTKVQTPRLETQTAAVSNGIEMTDSANGSIYCVRMTSGQLVSTLGACPTVASSTLSSTPMTATSSAETPATSATSATPVTTTTNLIPITPTTSTTSTSTTISTTTSTITSSDSTATTSVVSSTSTVPVPSTDQTVSVIDSTTTSTSAPTPVVPVTSPAPDPVVVPVSPDSASSTGD
jgi:hypothetical protein